MSRVIFLAGGLLASQAAGEQNGAALTPPMGWMSWQRFRCTTNCTEFPDDCINAKLMLEQADKMVSLGFKDVGYDQISIDDCYLVKNKWGPHGTLIPDPKRFPKGYKGLGEELHKRDLKFGVYSDSGKHTCGGYPAINNNWVVVANQMAHEWNIDYLKMDGCDDGAHYQRDYTNMSKALRATGRKITFSCSWPAYRSDKEKAKIYPILKKICNLWRNYDDVQDSWASVANIIRYWGVNSEELAKYAGPGSWNDPDQLIIGGYGLSQVQSQAQMAIWSIIAAPLIMGNDLRMLEKWQMDILMNKEVIAVNQDKMGKQGKRITDKLNGRRDVSLWLRELANGDTAIVVLNEVTGEGFAHPFTLDASSMGFPGSKVDCKDLYNKDVSYKGVTEIRLRVPGSGGVRMLRCSKSSE